MAVVADETPIDLPNPHPSLRQTNFDPGLSGDKGMDALRHRGALAVCTQKVEDWNAFYEDVLKRFEKGQSVLQNQ